MAMNNYNYARAAGIATDDAALTLVQRIRCAGAYLRNRAYRRFRRSIPGQRANDRWAAAIEASHAFEARQCAGLLRGGLK